MPMGMGYGYYWDPTYVLVIIGAVICMIASANVSGTYKKYNRVRNSRNMTGCAGGCADPAGGGTESYPDRAYQRRSDRSL